MLMRELQRFALRKLSSVDQIWETKPDNAVQIIVQIIVINNCTNNCTTNNCVPDNAEQIIVRAFFLGIQPDLLLLLLLSWVLRFVLLLHLLLHHLLLLFLTRALRGPSCVTCWRPTTETLNPKP